jgi:cell division protein FtsQ
VALTDVQSGAAAGRIERLPWVDRAHLVKRWPATVVVTVTERTPVALARAGDQWALVDGHGRLLEAGPGVGNQGVLPVIFGDGPLGRPGSSLPPGWASALRVATAIPQSLVGTIASITTTADGELELHMVPTGLVRFGRPDDVDQKLVSLATLLTQVKLRGSIVIDVRVPDAPAVTPA